MKQISILSILLLVLAFTFSCNDDSSDSEAGSVGSVVLPVEADTPASELTEEEIQDVCGEVYKAVMQGFESAQEEINKQIEDNTCAYVGVFATMYIASMDSSSETLSAVCDQTVSACESGDLDDEIAEMQDDMANAELMTEEEFCDGTDEDLQDCDATTGEIVDCMLATFDAQIKAELSVFASVPQCEDLTVEYFEEMDDVYDGAVELPSECDVVEEKCPELLVDMK